MTERQRRLQELRNYEKYIKEQLKESRRQYLEYLENPFKPYQPPLPLPAYPQRLPQHPPIRRYTRRTLRPPQRPLQAYPLPQQYPQQAYPLPQQYQQHPQQQQRQRYTQIPIENIQPESVDKFCRRHKYVKRIGVSSASNIPRVHKDLKKTVVKFKRDSNMPIVSPLNIPKVHKGLKEFDIKLKRSSRLSAIPES